MGRRREFKNFNASSLGVVRGRLSDTEPREINPALPKCPPQLRNSTGLVGKIYDVTLKQASCSGFKWIQASVSWTGGSQEFSVPPGIPGPLAVSSRCDNYHPALRERASLFHVLNNMFKTQRTLQTKSSLVCLHGQDGRFLTRDKRKSSVSVGAACTHHSSGLFHTAPFIILQQRSPPISLKLSD